MPGAQRPAYLRIRQRVAGDGVDTLVPAEHGGAHVLAQILLVSVSEQEARDRLWRREADRQDPADEASYLGFDIQSKARTKGRLIRGGRSC